VLPCLNVGNPRYTGHSMELMPLAAKADNQTSAAFNPNNHIDRITDANQNKVDQRHRQ